MQRPVLVFAIPGDPDQRTGGYLYDARLGRELADLGWDVVPLPLDGSFPEPTSVALADAAARLASLPEGSIILVDGLAFGAMPGIATTEAARLRLVAIVHHPLGLEAGLASSVAAALICSEGVALAQAAAVIVTSATTRRLLISDFGVAADRITVALPGTDARPIAVGSGGDTPTILAVGAVIPRKGYLTLVSALAPLRALRWRFVLVGSLDRDQQEAHKLRDKIDQLGLADRVTMTGELGPDALSAAYLGADIFVSASAFEGYGMALAEAVASGLPIVAVSGGAVAEWLDPAAAILVPPGNMTELSAALRDVLVSQDRRAALAQGAAAARQRLPSWAATGRAVSAVLRPLASA